MLFIHENKQLPKIPPNGETSWVYMGEEFIYICNEIGKHNWKKCDNCEAKFECLTQKHEMGDFVNTIYGSGSLNSGKTHVSKT